MEHLSASTIFFMFPKGRSSGASLFNTSFTNTWQHSDPSGMPPTIADRELVWRVACATGSCGHTIETKITSFPPLKEGKMEVYLTTKLQICSVYDSFVLNSIAITSSFLSWEKSCCPCAVTFLCFTSTPNKYGVKFSKCKCASKHQYNKSKGRQPHRAETDFQRQSSLSYHEEYFVGANIILCDICLQMKQELRNSAY